jgi:hypothetical protein
MLKGSELLHYSYLTKLSHNLREIDQDINDISSIIQEPIWIPEGYQEHTLCDLIILYKDFSASACELKGSMKQRHKAIKQIRAGKEYITEVLRYDYRYGIFVVYHERNYKYEIIK